jgi:hypothetical protein
MSNGVVRSATHQDKKIVLNSLFNTIFGVGKKQDELGRNGNISKFEVVN